MNDEKTTILRSDAARNIRRILDAGRATLRRNPQASVEEIARAAGLGVATVYRRFPTREELVRGVLEDIYTTSIAPALKDAENEEDPRSGVLLAFSAALHTASHEGVPIAAGMTMEIARSFIDPVSRLIRCAQQKGLMRADLDPEADTLRLLIMLLGVLPTLSPVSDGWNRYLRLVMDSLSLTPTEPLPPAEAVVDPFRHT
jgi:AcrR family transcriptional regulator